MNQLGLMIGVREELGDCLVGDGLAQSLHDGEVEVDVVH